jgi:hypothetical protein
VVDLLAVEQFNALFLFRNSEISENFQTPGEGMGAHISIAVVLDVHSVDNEINI